MQRKIRPAFSQSITNGGWGLPQRFQGNGGSQEGGKTYGYEKLVVPPSWETPLKAANGAWGGSPTITHYPFSSLNFSFLFSARIRVSPISTALTPKSRRI